MIDSQLNGLHVVVINSISKGGGGCLILGLVSIHVVGSLN